MLSDARRYDELRAAFSWAVPESFNIATAVCDRHAGDRGRLAIIEEGEDGAIRPWTFAEVAASSRRLANALTAHGVGQGDRVGILLPQSASTLIAHLAVYRIAAIALPLFALFGPDAVEHRLRDSGAKVLVTDDAGLAKLAEVRDDLPALRWIVSTGRERGPAVSGWDETLAASSDGHEVVATAARDPALIQYTSGTTGKPKGVLHAHHVLLGILPGVEFSHDFFPAPGDLVWTPADWAWGAGLLATLLPALFHGVPVVARRLPKFDPEAAAALMARHEVRNAFLPPTALRMMRQSASAASLARLDLRSVASGGERLGEEMLAWGRERLGVGINEIYGQTEANLVVSGCASIMDTPPASMGRAVPGHVVEIVDSEGRPVPPGTRGIIAVRAPDPVIFLGYWNDPEATSGKFRNGWILTGDVGQRDSDGCFYFHGRDDDVISSGGYRIGPDEIENCLLQHPAVAMAAVIGVPDPVRGEVVKAFTVPSDAALPSHELEAELRRFVQSRLSAHEHPRQIEFRATLPTTITGKLMRRDLRAEEARRTADGSS